MLGLLVEAETGENAGRAGRRAMGIDGIQPLVDLADAMVVGGVVGFGQQRGALGRHGEHGVEWGRRSARRLLGDIADRAILTAPRCALHRPRGCRR